MTVIKIEGKLEWKCFRAKGGNWVGTSAPLGLTVQAETWANLMEDIAQTLNAMLLNLVSTREIERFLLDRGWRPGGPIPTED